MYLAGDSGRTRSGSLNHEGDTTYLILLVRKLLMICMLVLCFYLLSWNTHTDSAISLIFFFLLTLVLNYIKWRTKLLWCYCSTGKNDFVVNIIQKRNWSSTSPFLRDKVQTLTSIPLDQVVFSGKTEKLCMLQKISHNFLHISSSTSQGTSGSADPSKIKVWPPVYGNHFIVIKKAYLFSIYNAQEWKQITDKQIITLTLYNTAA